MTVYSGECEICHNKAELKYSVKGYEDVVKVECPLCAILIKLEKKPDYIEEKL